MRMTEGIVKLVQAAKPPGKPPRINSIPKSV